MQIPALASGQGGENGTRCRPAFDAITRRLGSRHTLQALGARPTASPTGHNFDVVQPDRVKARRHVPGSEAPRVTSRPHPVALAAALFPRRSAPSPPTPAGGAAPSNGPNAKRGAPAPPPRPSERRARAPRTRTCDSRESSISRAPRPARRAPTAASRRPQPPREAPAPWLLRPWPGGAPLATAAAAAPPAARRVTPRDAVRPKRSPDAPAALRL